MKKFTTKQLKDALLGMKNQSSPEIAGAWRIACDELEARMGEDCFWNWMDENGL
jgi:hypothetical protein